MAVAFKSMLVAAALILVCFRTAEAVLAKDSTKHIDTSKTPNKKAMPLNFVVVGYGPPLNSSAAGFRSAGESKSTWVKSICDFAPPRPNIPASFRRPKLDALRPSAVPYPYRFQSKAIPATSMPVANSVKPKRTALSSRADSIKILPIKSEDKKLVPASFLP
ncbi:hypothetical protein BH11CYA1_BH11CYA1_48830 [soil metagenome]